MEVSIVVPLLNESESLPKLLERITAAMLPTGKMYEVILIDDGSTDTSWEVIQSLKKKHACLVALRLTKNFGKSLALSAGFKASRGNVVVTMDADLQDFPEEVPEMVATIEKGADLVSGWKQKRQDPTFSKNIPSKIFNGIARWTSGVQLHDFNCGLKAMKRELALNLKLYGDTHRYIPVLAQQLGYSKIVEQKVSHVARQFGQSKFGPNRFINGFLDLITLSFVSKFGSKPMHIFGAIGTLMFLFGAFLSLYLGLNKLWDVAHDIPARLITDNPWFYIALVVMTMGTQLFLAGFLGEMIVRNKTEKEWYTVAEKLM